MHGAPTGAANSHERYRGEHQVPYTRRRAQGAGSREHRARTYLMTSDEDKKTDKKIDRRTFVKQGLLAGGAVAGGALAVSRLADANDGSSARVNAAGATTSLPASAQPVAQTTPAGPRQPNILVIMVDQLRYPQWFGDGPGGPGCRPTSSSWAGCGSFARHYTASNDCTPARAALLTGSVYTPDRLHDHGGKQAGPGLPDLGHDAARTRLPHALATASGTSRTATTSGLRSTGARAGALRVRRWHLPVARRRARPGLARDPRIAGQFDSGSRAGRGRAVVHDGVVRQPARHRVVVRDWSNRVPRRGVRAERGRGAAAELRDARAAGRAQQAAPAALVPGNGRVVVRAGAVHRSRSHEGSLDEQSQPVRQASARG